MQYFTEQWYYSGCPTVPAYEEYRKTIAEKLPDFFKTYHSLHDAIIKRISVREEYWNHYEVTISLDSQQSYSRVERLVFHGKEAKVNEALVGARWIADEVFASGSHFALNVLLLCTDDEFRELNVVFDTVDVVLAL